MKKKRFSIVLFGSFYSSCLKKKNERRRKSPEKKNSKMCMYESTVYVYVYIIHPKIGRESSRVERRPSRHNNFLRLSINMQKYKNNLKKKTKIK
jgi:hypothetical protein